MIGQPTFGITCPENRDPKKSGRAKPTEGSSRTLIMYNQVVSNFCQPARETETKFVYCKIGNRIAFKIL